MIRFTHPQMLYLLWLVPVLFGLVWWEYKWKLSSMAKWADAKLWNDVLPNRAPKHVLWKRLLFVIAIGLVISALSGPQVGTHMMEVTRKGTDIAIAVDLSQSMLVEDLTPNRFQKARHEVGRFIEKLQGDRIALVPFAQVAFVEVPMTLDHGAVMSKLNALKPEMIPHPGTSLAATIKQAQRVFSNDSPAQKIIVIITDGEDHEADAVKEAKEAAKQGIIIYTIGMATPTGGPIPQKNQYDKVTGYKKDRSGNTIVSRLNEDLLTEISSVTNGEFYRATQTGSEFRQMYKTISGMNQEVFETKQFTDFEDRFQWPSALALLLIIIGQLIPPSRRRKL